MHLKNYFLLLIIILTSSTVFSQIDNSKEVKTGLFKYTPDTTSDEQQISNSSANTVQKEGETKTLFGSLEDIVKNFPKHSVIQEENKKSMSIKMDKDILIKKYWYGKDVSITKLETKVELGRIETNSNKIRIEFRDFGMVDADRVRVYINGNVESRSIVLQSGYYIINVNLKEGFNRIDIKALNTGRFGLNTAEFNVIDENGNILVEREWLMKAGYVATLVVNKY